jgi:OOP family OmpA-OmpF porin
MKQHGASFGWRGTLKARKEKESFRMLKRNSHTTLRSNLVRVLLPAAALSAVACGGTMPISGNINVAGYPPPVEAPKEEEPPKPPPRVEVRDNKIEIREKIQFELAKATIKEESHDLLNEIVQVIKDNPHIKKIAIEGHASSDGDDAFNMRLSDDRAKSVRKYLVDHGIGDGVLTAKGFGETKPIADNETEQGRVKNRRVEFNIVEQDITKKKVEIDPKTGKEKVVGETKTTVKEKEAEVPKDPAAEKKAAAEAKAAEAKAAAEKTAADKKAADEKNAADKKAADEKKAADKAAADAKAAEKK